MIISITNAVAIQNIRALEHRTLEHRALEYRILEHSIYIKVSLLSP